MTCMSASIKASKFGLQVSFPVSLEFTGQHVFLVHRGYDAFRRRYPQASSPTSQWRIAMVAAYLRI